MENMPFDVQLEFLEFEKLLTTPADSICIPYYKSVAHRDRVLQMPFAQGINMAHNRLQDIANKLR